MRLLLVAIILTALWQDSYGSMIARCMPGWVEPRGSDQCLLKPEKKWTKDFQQSRDHCQGQGGDSLMIKDKITRDYVRSLLSHLGIGDVYTNAHLKSDNKTWIWLEDQSPVNISLLSVANNGGPCGVMTVQGKLNGVPCEDPHEFMCHRGIEIPPPCDSLGGYQQNGDHCYRVSQKVMTWNDSLTDCKSDGGSLIVINNSTEQYYAKELVHDSSSSYVWIGLTEMGHPKTYDWVGGDTSNFTFWEKNEPSKTAHGKGCAAIDMDDDDGHWKSLDGTLVLNDYICEKEQGSCVYGWESFGDSCYYFNSDSKADKLMWYDANDTCTQVGAEFVTLESAEEEAFVFGHINQQYDYWLGLKSVPHVDFYWVDGTEMNYTSMSPEEKKAGLSKDSERCAYLQSSSDKAATWRGTDCNYPMYYICEAKKGDPLKLIYHPYDKYCPANYFLNDDSCYYFARSPLTFDDAETQCKSNKGHLASVHSFKENDFIFGHTTDYAFLGLTDQAQEGKWVWTDGTDLDVKNWLAGYPTGKLDKNCTVMSSINGEWVDVNCSSKFYYVCKTSSSDVPIVPDVTTTITSTTTLPLGGCPDGWTENPKTGECYLVVLEEKSFSLANEHCKTIANATLISLSTPEEQEFVVEWIQKQKFSAQSFLIGLMNSYSYGTYWLDQSPVTFFSFEDGRPSSSSYYTVLYPSTGKWSDVTSSEREAFICEKKGPAYRPPHPPVPPDPVCPDGWTSFNKHCYYFSEIHGGRRLTWDTASVWCESHLGSELATIETQAENNFINATTKVNMWIGLQSSDKHGKVWEWKDGSDYGFYKNWVKGRPDGKYHCGLFVPHYNGEWIDYKCNTSQAFVCRITLDLCPSGWDYSNQKCYYSSDFPATQKESRELCKKFNTKADLLTISSSTENMFVSKLITPHDYEYHYFWLGYVYDNRSRVWYWEDGSTNNYTKWYSGYPTQSSVESCTTMVADYSSSLNGYWKNRLCSSPYNFTCEYFPKHALTCDEDWMLYRDYCYLFGKKYCTFDEAVETCKKLGGEILSIHSIDEAEFVLYASEKTYMSVWLGITDKGHLNSMEFVDGTSVSYSRWAYITSSLLTYPKCAVIHEGSTYWSLHTCTYSSSYTYACKKPPQAADAHPQESGCNFGDLYWTGSCYHIPKEKYTWEDGKNACEQNQSTLVRIDDQFEGAFFAANLDQFGTIMWVDVKPRHYEDGSVDFIFDNGKLVTYLPWDVKQPNLEAGKCIYIMAESTDAGTYRIGQCNSKLDIICEYDRPGFTTPPPEKTTPHGTFCLSDWTHYNGHCYQVYNTSHTWSEGELLCRLYGGHLASINDKDEESAIHDIVKKNTFPQGTTALWVGLELATEADKRWSDGSSIDYIHWAPDQPVMHDHENCASAGIAALLLSCTVCEAHLPIICEAKEGSMTTTLPPPTFPPPVKCDDVKGEEDWYLFQEHCYKFVSSLDEYPMSWSMAAQRCLEDGSTLVSITNVTENYFLESMMYTLSDTELWTGGRASQDSGYTWNDGSAFKYVNWAPGEPSDADGTEDCIAMYTSNMGRWRDSNCAHQYGRICKRPYGTTAAPPPVTIAPIGYCPEGWVHEVERGRCFFFNPNHTIYEEAYQGCKQLHPNANLASIHSPKELAYIIAGIGEIQTQAYVGLIYEENEYIWTDQSPVNFIPWAPEQPDGGENCTKVVFPSGLLHDTSCHDSAGAICAMKQDHSIKNPTDFPRCELPYTNYYRYDDDCISVSDKPLSWREAEVVCAADGGHLASTLNLNEDAFLWVIAQDRDVSNPWIGLNNLENEKTYEWTDGWPILYTGWGQGQPQESGSNKNCVQLNTTDGLWYNQNCGDKKNFFCKHSGALPPTVDPALPFHCHDNNFVDVPGDFCYLLVNDYKPWNDAYSYCLLVDANLTSIHSDYENSLLLNAVRNVGRNIWIGLIAKQDSFEWSDKSPLNYINWLEGEPSGQYQQCVEFSQTDGTWDDISCNVKRPFACKAAKIPGIGPINPSGPSHTTKSPYKGGPLSAGAICGIVFSVVFLFAVIGFAGYTYWRGGLPTTRTTTWTKTTSTSSKQMKLYPVGDLDSPTTEA